MDGIAGQILAVDRSFVLSLHGNGHKICAYALIKPTTRLHSNEGISFSNMTFVNFDCVSFAHIFDDAF
jgi:hypothetical protein